MVWILLLVHITLHGMIGGLLKHFPKAVCGIIFFICKSILNVKKESCFFYLSLKASVTFTHTTSTSPILSWESRIFFLFYFSQFSGLPVFVFGADQKMQSAWNSHHSQPQSAIHTDAIFPLVTLNLEFLLETLRHTNLPQLPTQST